MAERVNFLSPKGEALYLTLNKTETYKGKDTGNYVVKLVLTGDALEQVKAQVEEFLVNIYGPKQAKIAKRPFKTTEDGSKTYITFKARAEINGKPRVIGIFDAKGVQVKHELNIGSGSIIKVNGTMSSWTEEPGVSFYMSAIQVIKYVETPPVGGFDADDTEGGFEGDVFDTQEPAEGAKATLERES